MLVRLFSLLERPRDPRPMALFRIALFAGLLVHFGPSLWNVDVDYATGGARLRLHSEWLYAHLGDVPRGLVHALALLLVTAMMAGMIGAATRLASATTMLLTWVFASWNALPVQTIALGCAWSFLPVLAVLPGASSTWSVDAALCRRRGLTPPPTTTVASVSLWLVVLPFFFAGIEKLVVGWVTNNEMAMLFRTPRGYILRDVAFWLPLQDTWFSAGIGVGTVVIELVSPVLLCFRRTRWLGLFLWQGLFFGIVALIEVPPLFFALFFFGAFLFLDSGDLERIANAVRRRHTRGVEGVERTG